MKKLTAVLLSTILVGGAVGGIGYKSKGFKDWSKENWHIGSVQDESEDPPIAVDADGNAVKDGMALPVQMTFMPLNANISRSVTVTATVMPESASNKKVDYSVRFDDPESAWAAGKDPIDYVTVTQDGDGSASAVVSYMAAFGEPIRIVCASRDNPDVTASCKVDCLRSVRSARLKIGDKTYGSLNGIDPLWNINKTGTGEGGICTVDLDFTVPFTAGSSDYDIDVKLISNSEKYGTASDAHLMAGNRFCLSSQSIDVYEKSVNFDRNLLHSFGCGCFVDGVFRKWSDVESIEPLVSAAINSYAYDIAYFSVTVKQYHNGAEIGVYEQAFPLYLVSGHYIDYAPVSSISLSHGNLSFEG